MMMSPATTLGVVGIFFFCNGFLVEGWAQPRTVAVQRWPTTTAATSTTSLFSEDGSSSQSPGSSESSESSSSSDSSSFDINEMPFFIASDGGEGIEDQYISLEPDPETPTMELEEAYKAKQREEQQLQKQHDLFRPDVQARARYPADDLTVEKDVRVMVPNLTKKTKPRQKQDDNNNKTNQRSMLSPSEMPKTTPLTKEGHLDVQSRKRYPDDDLSVEKDVRVAVPSLAKAQYSQKNQRSMLRPAEMSKSTVAVPKQGLFEVSGTGYNDSENKNKRERNRIIVQQQQQQQQGGIIRSQQYRTKRHLPAMFQADDNDDVFDISGTGYDSKHARKEREAKKQQLMMVQKQQQQQQQTQQRQLPEMLQADDDAGSTNTPPSSPPLTKRQQDLLVDRDVRVAFPSLERKKLDRTMMQPAAVEPQSSSFTSADDLFKVDGSGYESPADKLRKKRERFNEMMGILNDDSMLPFNAQPNMMGRNKKTMAPIGGSMVQPLSAEEMKGKTKPVAFEFENWGNSGNGGTDDGIGFTEVKQSKKAKQRLDSIPTGKSVPFRQEGATDSGQSNPMWMTEDKPAPKPKQERFDLGKPIAFRQEGSTDEGRPNPMWMTESKPATTLKPSASAASLSSTSTPSSSSGAKPAKFTSTKPVTTNAKGFGAPPSTLKSQEAKPSVETEDDASSPNIGEDDILRSEVMKAHDAAVDAIKTYAATTLSESQEDVSSTDSTTSDQSIESIIAAAGGIDEILKSDNPLAMIDEMVAAEVAKAEEEAQRQIEMLEAQRQALMSVGGGGGSGDAGGEVASESSANTNAQLTAYSNTETQPPPAAATPKPISSQQVTFNFGRKVQLASDDDIYNKR
eukprot:CAMPEP_0113507484 /NCGR_PEP_ID=MMETSP0014_2-20120614/36489_1 /TAXON_ID=2857 /ORGANISM="Nitzschia sp." /LENGTH=850 /DNA_ID=CAMNT_0000403095 /DNA_START=31 /DNA_END=2583 /DNA_ORIENTATION=+ /assembly_acc=CAM_ASM_000159